MNERDKELADKVRFVSTATPPTQDEILQHFADLIRADEREACAKVVIDIAKDESSIALVLEAVADAIRARGNT
jgi:hypothetical protein